MYTFAVEQIEEIKAKTGAYKLVINGKCLFDEFYDEIYKDGNLKRELIKLIAILESHCNGYNLPVNKFRELKRNKSDHICDYEVKTSNLRLYFFRDREDRIVILGGKKKTQEKDIAKMRRIKLNYFSTKK